MDRPGGGQFSAKAPTLEKSGLPGLTQPSTPGVAPKKPAAQSGASAASLVPSTNTVANLAAGTTAMNQATAMMQGQANAMSILAQAVKDKPATTRRMANSVAKNLSYVPEKYEKWVNAAARKYNLDPRLVASVGQVESGWSSNVNLKSSAGAVGPMQIMPFWQGSQPYNIRKYKGNIFAGTHILKSYINDFGIKRGLAAYNAGPGNLSAGLDYSRLVRSLYRKARR
jgi:soluble lytic murein transglycosylase-like protein